MRDPDRIARIIEKLHAIWRENPDWRLGQLIFNMIPRKILGGDIFFIEDDDWEEQLDLEIEREEF